MYPGHSRCVRFPQRDGICNLDNAKYDTFMSRFLSNLGRMNSKVVFWSLRRRKLCLAHLRSLCYKQLSIHETLPITVRMSYVLHWLRLLNLFLESYLFLMMNLGCEWSITTTNKCIGFRFITCYSISWWLWYWSRITMVKYK